MDTKPIAVSAPPGLPDLQADSAPAGLRRVWHNIRGRILGGLLLALPILITLWIILWLYSCLEKYVIDPLALLVLWLVQGRSPDTELPFWFETYAAPVIAIIIALVLLYLCGFFVHSRLRQAIDWILLRVPVISVVYNGVRNVFQSLDTQRGQQRLQRAVLVTFPHPGIKTPAFVTATCRDIATQKVLLWVFVPTAPMPVSGFLLLVPEEEVTDLNWGPEPTLQTLISVGLTTPKDVAYFPTKSAAERNPLAASVADEVPTSRQADRQSPLA
jgi:uncharacterized membrane protein